MNRTALAKHNLAWKMFTRSSATAEIAIISRFKVIQGHRFCYQSIAPVCDLLWDCLFDTDENEAGSGVCRRHLAGRLFAGQRSDSGGWKYRRRRRRIRSTLSLWSRGRFITCSTQCQQTSYRSLIVGVAVVKMCPKQAMTWTSTSTAAEQFNTLFNFIRLFWWAW